MDRKIREEKKWSINIDRTRVEELLGKKSLSLPELAAALVILKPYGVRAKNIEMDSSKMRREFEELADVIASFSMLQRYASSGENEISEKAELQIECVRRILFAETYDLNIQNLREISSVSGIKPAKAHGFLLAWLVRKIEMVAQPKDIRRKHHHETVRVKAKEPIDPLANPIEYEIKDMDVSVYFSIAHNEDVILRLDMPADLVEFARHIEPYFHKRRRNTIQAIAIDMYLRAVDEKGCHRPTPRQILSEMREFLDNEGKLFKYDEACGDYLRLQGLLPFIIPQKSDEKRRRFPK